LPLPSLLDHSTSVASSCKRIQRAEREEERGREKDRGARVARQSAIRRTTIHSLNDIHILFTCSTHCRQSVCGHSLTQAQLPVPTGSSSCRNPSYHSRVTRWMGGWGEWRDGRAVEGTWRAVHLTPPEHTHTRTHSHTSPHTTLLMMQTHTRARAPSLSFTRTSLTGPDRPAAAALPFFVAITPPRPTHPPEHRPTSTGWWGTGRNSGEIDTALCASDRNNRFWSRFWWFWVLGSPRPCDWSAARRCCTRAGCATVRQLACALKRSSGQQ
jgi:hypothetical protein